MRLARAGATTAYRSFVRQPADLSRYHRQMLLPSWGEEGQRRIEQSHVLIVGCGALGCASAEILARAGVGAISIFDRDVVELTNLQRQCLFDEPDAAEGLPKAEAAKRRLGAINSQVWVTAVVADFNRRTALNWFDPGLREGHGGSGAVAVVVDGTDNFQTRYLINDLCVKFGIPYAYGGAVATSGMQATFTPDGPCLRCVFPEMPDPGTQPTCDTAGVLGPLIQIVAACQASDALKILLGKKDLLSPTLLELDLWQNRRRRIDFASLRGPGTANECPCCGKRQFEFLDGKGEQEWAVLCGTNSVQIAAPSGAGQAHLDIRAVGERLRRSGDVQANAFLVRATLPHERAESGGAMQVTVFPDGRAIVKGTSRVETARAIYARYVGA